MANRWCAGCHSTLLPPWHTLIINKETVVVDLRLISEASILHQKQPLPINSIWQVIWNLFATIDLKHVFFGTLNLALFLHISWYYSVWGMGCVCVCVCVCVRREDIKSHVSKFIIQGRDPVFTPLAYPWTPSTVLGSYLLINSCWLFIKSKTKKNIGSVI